MTCGSVFCITRKQRNLDSFIWVNPWIPLIGNWLSFLHSRFSLFDHKTPEMRITWPSRPLNTGICWLSPHFHLSVWVEEKKKAAQSISVHSLAWEKQHWTKKSLSSLSNRKGGKERPRERGGRRAEMALLHLDEISFFTVVVLHVRDIGVDLYTVQSAAKTMHYSFE